MSEVLVVGCGFVGLETARLFHADGWKVTGVTHSPESADRLASEPFPVVACDITDRAALAGLGRFGNVVDCVSSGRGGAEVYRQIYLEGARNLLEVIAPEKLLFTSSSSVFAQTDGSWVTEESPTEPDRETSRILLETERLVLASGGIVARLAGIYGPGRSVLLRKFLEGTAVIEGDGTRWINQIHRDDAASAIHFLVTSGAVSGVYNVVDDTPVSQATCFGWLAEHFGRPLPPTGPIDLNRKRGWTHKRVSNAKLKGLGWHCRYPSFRDALSVL